nr:protein diaphanous homolog 1 [Helicoverpa armigera]
MMLRIVTQFLVLLFIAVTGSQFAPPAPFPYPFQQGQPPMHMMPMPNSQPMMQMPNGQMMQMPNAPPMMPHMPRLPGMPSGPMPVPMAFPMNGGRLPMVVTPHHSKKADKPRKSKRKPKRKRVNMESSSSEGSCSESAEYRSRNNLRSSKKKRREVLTPVVSYVTKEGYVVYQKKIKKDKAKDWLEMAKGEHESEEYKDKIRFKDRSS